MIDIHSHILPGVDDGSQSLELSLKMIQKEVEDGVKAVILTPHVQSHVTNSTHDDRKTIFNQLVKEIKNLNLPIELYFGAEIFYRAHIQPDYNEISLAGSKYLLLEFSPAIETPIEEIVYDFSRMGYIPIVAHVERYQYLNFEDYYKIKSSGALLQVNTNSVLENDNRIKKGLVTKLLKHKLIDLISTDTHNMDIKIPNMKDAYIFLQKSIDPTYLNALFYDNALKIITK